MKPMMLFSIVLLTAIVLASSFGLQIMPVTPTVLPDDAAGMALFVCPTDSSTWTMVATALRPMVRFISMAFFFGFMMLLFSWGWALYQNLLKDSFKQDAFQKPWALTKFMFWAGMIVLLLVATPNHYRAVHVVGASGEWVLCDDGMPGAIPVWANNVKS
ncbi:MAG: hypothetical protein K2L95_01895 [Alphaproteobacteria bacterium]|nr:hypothetical protein [Alphaproteobacteria bacterium]MDE6570950.1 hypothetical protein [Alphaproteobacteria bacterium]